MKIDKDELKERIREIKEILETLEDDYQHVMLSTFGNAPRGILEDIDAYERELRHLLRLQRIHNEHS